MPLVETEGTKSQFGEDCQRFGTAGEIFFLCAIRPGRLQKEAELFGRTLLACPFLDLDPQRLHLFEVRFTFQALLNSHAQLIVSQVRHGRA